MLFDIFFKLQLAALPELCMEVSSWLARQPTLTPPSKDIPTLHTLQLTTKLGKSASSNGRQTLQAASSSGIETFTAANVG